MNVDIWTRDARTLATEAVAVFVFEEETPASPELMPFDAALPGLLPTVFGTEMRGKVGDIVTLHATSGLEAKRLILVGAGAREKFDYRALRQRSAQVARVAAKRRHFPWHRVARPPRPHAGSRGRHGWRHHRSL